MIDKIIRMFGLKGSWKWAKAQMMKGCIVRCRHWSGTLILKIDEPDNALLKMGFFKRNESNRALKWETSNHFLSYEDFTDYEIWEKIND